MVYQFWFVGHFGANSRDQALPQLIVLLVDQATVGTPVIIQVLKGLVSYRRLNKAVAIPARVSGHVPQQPLSLLGDRGLIAANRGHPVWGSLIDGDMGCLFGHARQKLGTRGTRADQRYPFAGVVIVVVPLRGVEHCALEGFNAFYRRILWFVEQAGTTEHHIGRKPFRLAISSLDVNEPSGSTFMPLSVNHPGVEHRVLAQVVLVNNMVDVGHEFFTWRKCVLPRVVGLKGEAIDKVGDVHPRIGIGV